MSRFYFALIFFSLWLPLLWLVPAAWFLAILLGIGIPHVLLGIKYSKKGLIRAWDESWQKLILLILIPLSIYLGSSKALIWLVLFFGIHHALSESYSSKSLLHGKNGFMLSYFTIILTAYFFACRQNITTNTIVINGLGVAFLGSFLWFIIKLSVIKKSLKTDFRKIIIEYPWILASPLLVIMSLAHPISWEIIIFYHFIYWGLLPLFRKSMFKGNKDMRRVFWKDAIVYNGIGLISMIALAFWSTEHSNYTYLKLVRNGFYMMTYYHISISFIISGSNPVWIKNLFTSKIQSTD